MQWQISEAMGSEMESPEFRITSILGWVVGEWDQFSNTEEHSLMPPYLGTAQHITLFPISNASWGQKENEIRMFNPNRKQNPGMLQKKNEEYQNQC